MTDLPPESLLAVRAEACSQSVSQENSIWRLPGSRPDSLRGSRNRKAKMQMQDVQSLRLVRATLRNGKTQSLSLTLMHDARDRHRQRSADARRLASACGGGRVGTVRGGAPPPAPIYLGAGLGADSGSG